MALDIFHYMHDLKNINEKRVWSMLSDYIENSDTSDMCLCGICLTDIAAITLNSIPTHYQVEEHLTSAQEKVSDTEIFRQMKRAIAMVKVRPHH
jgi:competence protein ComFB